MASPYEDYIRTLMGTVPASGAVAPVLYAPQRAAMEDQYRVAQGQLQSSLPAGGQLNSALANLMLQRANAVGGLTGNLYNQALNRAPAIAGLGMGMEQANRARTSQTWGGMGTGLGILAGLALGTTNKKGQGIFGGLGDGGGQ
jgi:hypothetical protein